MKTDKKKTSIINVDNVIDEMHKIFIKNQPSENKKISMVDDFIADKLQEYFIEEARSRK